MLRRAYFLALSPLLGYEQKFAEAREVFASRESCNSEDPFGEMAAISLLFLR